MRIDSSHRPWYVVCLAVTLMAAAAYIPHASGNATLGGGSPLGLVFGVTGYVLMVYAALLGVRKKFPIWRVGRASTWMRGHLWLGFLSFPLLLLHSGFAANGPLTAWLMVLLIGAIGTGVLGALAQHFLPSVMTRSIPLETIYEQIPMIRSQLLAEADQLALAIANTKGSRPTALIWGARASRASPSEPLEIAAGDTEHLQEVYRETIRPFLVEPERVRSECGDKDRSAALFAGLRASLPITAHQILTDLENICEEERQLTKQRFLYRCLHSWLLVHVPLSLALIFLGGIHAVVALGY